MAKRKYSDGYVKGYLKDKGCELVDEKYNGYAGDSFNYKCSCGRISRTDFCTFKRKGRCKTCARKGYTTDFIRKYLADQGCVFLDAKYDWRVKFNYSCSCGRTSNIDWRGFKDGKRCRSCGIKKAAESRRGNIENVKSEFKDRGCTLLEEKYQNDKKLMNYICSCGERGMTSLSALRKRKRGCRVCYNIGIANPRWNPNREEVKDREKNLLESATQCCIMF